MCDAAARPIRARPIPRPRWSLVYGLVVGALAALAVVEVAVPPGAARVALRVAVSLGAFAALSVWVRLSRVALDMETWCDCAAATVTVRVIQSRRPQRVAPPIGPLVPVAGRQGDLRNEEEDAWSVPSARR